MKTEVFSPPERDELVKHAGYEPTPRCDRCMLCGERLREAAAGP